MGARKTKDELMDVEWEFDNYDEMKAAAEKEARVCGDDLREQAHGRFFEIFNSHQSSVRWKGYLSPHAWEHLKVQRAISCKNYNTGDKVGDAETACAMKKRFTVVLTHEELSCLQDGDRDVRNLVVKQILEQAWTQES